MTIFYTILITTVVVSIFWVLYMLRSNRGNVSDAQNVEFDKLVDDTNNGLHERQSRRKYIIRRLLEKNNKIKVIPLILALSIGLVVLGTINIAADETEEDNIDDLEICLTELVSCDKDLDSALELIEDLKAEIKRLRSTVKRLENERTANNSLSIIGSHESIGLSFERKPFEGLPLVYIISGGYNFLLNKPEYHLGGGIKF